MLNASWVTCETAGGTEENNEEVTQTSQCPS